MELYLHFPSCLHGLIRGGIIHCLWPMNADTNEEKWAECWAAGRGPPCAVIWAVAFLSRKLFVNAMSIMLWIHYYFVAQCMNNVTGIIAFKSGNLFKWHLIRLTACNLLRRGRLSPVVFQIGPPVEAGTLSWCMLVAVNWPFKRWIKSHLLFAGIIRSSPFSPR